MEFSGVYAGRSRLSKAIELSFRSADYVNVTKCLLELFLKCIIRGEYFFSSVSPLLAWFLVEFVDERFKLIEGLSLEVSRGIDDLIGFFRVMDDS